MEKQTVTTIRGLVYKLRCSIAEEVFGWCFSFCLWMFPKGSREGTLMAMHVSNWASAVLKEMKDGRI